MKKRIGAFVLCIGLGLFMACQKKESVKSENVEGNKASSVVVSECGKEFVTGKPVKVGETGILLPAGTKICITRDELEVRVELPAGYNFYAKELTEKALPIFATYTCICSQSNSSCKVFFIDDWGFGCLQSSCTGSCTGKFTYKGYTVDKVLSTTTELVQIPEIQKEIEAFHTHLPYEKFSVYGVSFYLVNDLETFKKKASCNCEGTQACSLKTMYLPGTTIYYCEGPCNGCELTVS